MNIRVERFDVDLITVPDDRLRGLDADAVQRIANSIAELGLRTPITVLDVNEGERLDLVTGAHRLAAVKKLGLAQIDCFIIEGDDEIDAKLWEIDENLMRASLSPAEEAEHLKLRKELWEAKAAAGKTFPTSLADGRKAGPQHQAAFAAETATATGETKRSINQKISRAEAICADAMDLVKGTKLDTGVYLDKLKPLPPNDQVHAVKRDLAIDKKADRAERDAKQARHDRETSAGKSRQETAISVTEARRAFEYGRLIAFADEIGMLKSADIVAGCPPRQRAALCQRASSLIDLLSEVMEGASK